MDSFLSLFRDIWGFAFMSWCARRRTIMSPNHIQDHEQVLWAWGAAPRV